MPPTFDEVPPPAEADSPFGGASSSADYSGETRAIPRMSFEEMRQMAAETTAPAPAPASPEPSPWEEQPSAAPFGQPAEPRAPMDFDATPQHPMHTDSSGQPAPWDDQAPAGGETRAFPRMSFEDMQQMASQAGESDAASMNQATSAPFSEPEPAPFGAASDEPASAPAEPAWSAPAMESRREEPSSVSQASAQDSPALPIARHDLTDDQVDRIARRVVEMMSDQIVRNIAWEVIPDLAEMVVKERIRQLESEA